MSLVQQYGRLENVLEACRPCRRAVQRALEAIMEQRGLSKWTATIKVDMTSTCRSRCARLYYDEGAVRELVRPLEFRSLLRTARPRRGQWFRRASGAGKRIAPLPATAIAGTDVEIVVDAHQAEDALQRVRAAGAMASAPSLTVARRRHDRCRLRAQGRGHRLLMPVWHAGLGANADPAAVAAVEECSRHTIPKGLRLKRGAARVARRGIGSRVWSATHCSRAYSPTPAQVPELPSWHDLALLSVEARRRCSAAAAASADR